ncbi:unnamed protein product [Cuscuta campestris]|uniref:Uncharacterized protein n=1 Tax=Cuscuta campestris TaxID=132261 RepID=A0A484MTM6_9ASTE|nr:unnamed protein product [Cuscuta campestris]
MGSVHRPSSYSSTRGYGEGRYSGHYGSRDDNRIGYGKERGWSHRDEDIYGDSYGRHGERYDREYEERNSHYAYTDSDYRGSGTSKSIDEYGSRSKSFEREREIACDGSDHQSSRGSGAEDLPHNERQQLERKFSEQNLAPLSLEEAAGAPTQTAGDVGTSPVTAESSSYQTYESPSQDTGAPEKNEAVELSEFDPHVSLSAAHCASSTTAGPEVDLLGALFEPLSSNSLALVPAGSLTGTSQDIKNPFGDEPFKAIPSSNGVPSQPPDVTQPTSHISDQDIDILADILPPSRLSQSEQPLPTCQFAPHIGFPPQATQQALHIRFVSQNGLIAQHGAGSPSQSGQATFMTSFAAQPGQQLLQTTLQTSHVDSQMWFPAQTNHQPQSLALVPSQAAPYTGFVGSYNNAPLCQFSRSMCIQAGETTHDNNSMNFSSHHGALAQAPSQMAALQSPRTQTETIPPYSTQPAKEKFETKSTIWTDTLNRGLVNLNISGPKTNPLADIGVDFDAMNRKEKRMASPSNSTAPSITMGKAMGCGSGIGRAGAGALRPLQTQMVSAHPAAAGIPMGGYRGPINQTMGIGMMRPLLPQQQIQQPNSGFPPGTNVTAGQYPLPGTTYFGHQPFGGGYHR